jgi:GT2 family glycosyltransferase
VGGGTAESRMNYAVVIINWNGADDTLACLQSFVTASPSAVPIVVDNGSADDSVARIAAWFAQHGMARTQLVEAGENLGFAAGCNLGLRAVAALGIETVVFLNNDTVVEGDALDRIVARLSKGDVFVCLPMLTVHGTDRIWNCGGEVHAAGWRRYHHAGADRATPMPAEIRCSFFTGCCFAVGTQAFVARGGFSERFFFGEEDFELALWMKARSVGALCLTTAVVQHKVSASFSRAARHAKVVDAKVFIYYLNRFIHMRLRLGTARWWVWATAYLVYVVALLLCRSVVKLGDVPRFVSSLLRHARTMNGVTRSDFERVMRDPLNF